MSTESANLNDSQVKSINISNPGDTQSAAAGNLNTAGVQIQSSEAVKKQPERAPGARGTVKTVLVVGAVAILAAMTMWHFVGGKAIAAAEPALPTVAVSMPVQRDVESQLQVLGQFSAVDRVELRAQVGGTLTQIGFKDGDIVNKGDLLFVIDPTQYEIKLSQATALRESAKAKFDLTERELQRAKTLKTTGAGTIENVDQREADQEAAQAAMDGADAQVRDARFDLDHTRITAPFSGRIGSHQVSVGNLIAGSRAATSPTTLLTTIVSLDPIYLDFDMSEADYASFQQERVKQDGPLADKVLIALNGNTDFNRQGTLDFMDNALDRSSGTIHARATVANADFLLTPGAFGRVKVAISAPTAALLVPDAAVVQDQSQYMVFTVGESNVVTPKIVEVGELQNGLRVIRFGLTPTDKVIIDSIPLIHPGAKVTPETKSITAETSQPAKSIASNTK